MFYRHKISKIQIHNIKHNCVTTYFIGNKLKKYKTYIHANYRVHGITTPIFFFSLFSSLFNQLFSFVRKDAHVIKYYKNYRVIKCFFNCYSYLIIIAIFHFNFLLIYLFIIFSTNWLNSLTMHVVLNDQIAYQIPLKVNKDGYYNFRFYYNRTPLQLIHPKHLNMLISIKENST